MSKTSGKSLPPWLQGKGDDKAQGKPKKMANGGAVGMYARERQAAQPMVAQRAAAAGAAAGAQQGAQQAAMAQRAAAAPAAAAAGAAGAAAGMKRRGYADGGKMTSKGTAKIAKFKKNKASNPKTEARSDPKMAGNAKGRPLGTGVKVRENT
jgi:hypothetical protein